MVHLSYLQCIVRGMRWANTVKELGDFIVIHGAIIEDLKTALRC